MGPADYGLVITLSPLVADVWSVETVTAQLFVDYASAVDGRPAEPPSSFVQYSQWTRSQNDWLASDAGRLHRQWWVDQLADRTGLQLPGRRALAPPVPAVTRAHEFWLPEDLYSLTRTLSLTESATVHNVLTAVYRLLLGEWTGQHDLTVGCPTPGRGRAEVLQVPGPFVDAMVLRLALPDDPTFRELVGRVRDATAEAHTRGDDVPMAQVLADLETAHGAPQGPLYGASITLHYPNNPPPPPTGVHIGPFPVGTVPSTAIDLELAVFVQDDGSARGGLLYRSDVVSDEEAERFGTAFPVLLAAALENPDAVVSSHRPMLSPRSSTGPSSCA